MGQKHSKGFVKENARSAKVVKEREAGNSSGNRNNMEDRHIDVIEEVEIMEDSVDEEDTGQGNENSNTQRNSKALDKHNSFHFLTTQSQSSLLFDEPFLDEEIDLDEEDEFGTCEEKNELMSKYSLDDGKEESLPSPLSIKVKEGSGRDSLKESNVAPKGDKQATLKKPLSIEISQDVEGSDVKSPSSPSTLKNLLTSPKYPSEEEDNAKGSDEKISGDSGVFSSNPFSMIKDGWSKRKLQFRKAAYSAVGPLLRPAYLHLSELFIDRLIEENEIKIYVLVTSVDCRKYELPVSSEKGDNSSPRWKIRGQIRSESFYLKSGKNILKERLLLPAVSSDTILVVSLVQTFTFDDSHKSKSKSVHKNTISEDHEPDFIWAQAFYSIHDVKCTVEKTKFALNLELPTESKTPEKTSVSPSQSFINSTISPSNATSLRDELPFPFEAYHTDTFDNGKSRKKRTYFPIHFYNKEKETFDTQNSSSQKIDAPELSISGEIEFVHNSRGSAGIVVVLRDHEIPSEKNVEKPKATLGNRKDSQSKTDSRKSVFNDHYIFDNNVSQDALTLDEIDYEEIALEDPRNRYWLVVAKEIYLLKSYLDTNDDLETKRHRLCDINYVNGPLIGHCTKSILVQIGDEQPWRIVTTNEEEYLHWFQILNALAFESNFLESDDE